MKRIILVLVILATLLIKTSQIGAQAGNIVNKSGSNQFELDALILDIRNTFEKIDFKRGIQLASIAIKYQNNEINLSEDEILKFKQESIGQIGIALEQIDYLIGKHGYPKEAFEKVTEIIPKPLVDFTIKVTEIAQLNLTTEEKVNILMETYLTGDCGLMLTYFFWSLIAIGITLLYILLIAIVFLGNPVFGVLLIILGLPLFAVALLGVLIVAAVVVILPYIVYICLVGL